jgi:heat-inducible transcriptional repressor
MARPVSAAPQALDPRHGEILRDLVARYIASGEPVSSRALARLNREQLSAASVRNVLSDLEELGLVSHPHSSAGCVPTDAAVRMHAREALSRVKPDSDLTLSCSTTLRQEGDDLDLLAASAARVLSTLTRQMAVVLLPPLSRLKIRHIELIPYDGRKVLAVLVGEDGQVRHRMVETRILFTAAELTAMGNYLRSHCLGMTLAAARDFLRQTLLGERAQYDSRVGDAAVLGTALLDLPMRSELHMEGAAGLLAEAAQTAGRTPPDFSALLAAIEDKGRWIELLEGLAAPEGEGEGQPTVLVGRDVGAGVLSEFSLLAAPYFQGTTPLGSLAVMGPKRMRYAELFGQVSALAAALSGVLSDKR